MCSELSSNTQRRVWEESPKRRPGPVKTRTSFGAPDKFTLSSKQQLCRRIFRLENRARPGICLFCGQTFPAQVLAPDTFFLFLPSFDRRSIVRLMSNAPATKILFHEEQQFRQPWLWLVLGAVAAMFWYLFFLQIILPHPRGAPHSLTIYILILWLVCGIGMPLFFYQLRLITEVRADGIYVRFFPMHFSFKRIGFEEIKHFEARTYRPIAEYGGWGIRYGLHGKAYNVSGNRGLQLELTTGKKLLLGTQRPEEFLAALQNRAR